ncbi:type IIL restriction-modification enzyme MmeI [Mangrovibrevibacter kandeliae]|uniref:type IIL restriction-modification enzyme MmeI n=1 Tax=Mangrovibrevibacter kandeliae TaxID=2968473 RepID=UPI0029FED2E0|nr:type IIL restriction-modification enzyme MmeI [Aurantimonas sp. MSK8Z-1]
MDDRQRGEGTEATVEAFIAMWSASGGAENANAQGFIRDLCDLLDVPRPDATRENEAENVYVFEKRVDHHDRGVVSANRIDYYKRDCFILEAKQSSSQSRRAAADPSQGELLPSAAAAVRGGTAKRGTAAWDKAMRSAYNQAVSYVGDLPAGHRPPPFVLLVDVGHVIELYANFSGQGRNYTQFPTASLSRSAWRIFAIPRCVPASRPSGPIRTRSIRRRSQPRSRATSPSAWRGLPAAWKSATTRRTSPSS